MKRQTGVTLSGMIFFLLLLSLAASVTFRIAPGYVDYWLVSRALDKLAAQPDIQSNNDEGIREQFAKQLNMNNISLVNRSDLLIERIPGGVKLSAAFSTKKPLLGSLSLCLDFQAEASSGNPSGN